MSDVRQKTPDGDDSKWIELVIQQIAALWRGGNHRPRFARDSDRKNRAAAAGKAPGLNQQTDNNFYRRLTGPPEVPMKTKNKTIHAKPDPKTGGLVARSRLAVGRGRGGGG